MKLATKLTLIFLLLSIIPLVVVGFLAFDSGRQAIEQDLTDHLISTTILKETELEAWIDDSKRDIRVLAARPGFQQYTTVLTSQDPASPEYQSAYKRLRQDGFDLFLQEQTSFLDLSLIHARDGRILVSTNDGSEGKYRENETFFVEGQKDTFVENITYSVTADEQVMYISTPVKDENGNVVAVLSGRLNLTDISAIMARRSGLRATEETYLVNTFNFMVTESRFESNTSIRRAIYTEGVNNCLAGHDGSGFYNDYRGVPVIGVYQWIPEREMCIVTEIDQAEAFQPVVDLRNTIFLVGLGIDLIVIGSGLFFARTVTGPVHRLVEGTQEIARGNLDFRVDTTAKDEIGQLSRAFDQMVEVLRKTTVSRDELEQRVIERTEELSDLYNNAPCGYHSLDSDGIFERINDTELAWLGHTRDEIIGKVKFRDLLTSASVQTFDRVLSALEEGDGVNNLEFEMVRKDGSILPVLLSAIIHIDQEGRYLISRATIIDHTERKRAEAALLESEEKFRRFSEAAFEAIVLHENGVVIEANNQYAEMFGYKLDELLGKQVISMIIAPEAREDVRRQIATGNMGPYESTGVKKDGTQFPIEIRIREMDYKRRKVRIAATMDITERKRAEEALQQRTVQLEASNKELEAFSYSVSHDLRAPLRAMDGFSRILLDEYAPNLPDEAQRYLGLVRDNARQMGNLIDHLLAFSRLGRQQLKKEQVASGDLVRAVLAGLSTEREGCEVEITIGDLPPCQADPALLRQVFTNLLGNAFKFTKTRNPAIIEIGCDDQAGEPVYFVRDNGVGFDMQYANKLFGVFQRLHRAEDYEGTGVGLATVQRIIHRHGGRIWAESELDKGTTFYFTIGEGDAQ